VNLSRESPTLGTPGDLTEAGYLSKLKRLCHRDGKPLWPVRSRRILEAEGLRESPKIRQCPSGAPTWDFDLTADLPRLYT